MTLLLVGVVLGMLLSRYRQRLKWRRCERRTARWRESYRRLETAE